MTGILRDVMTERAGALAAPAVDLDAVVRDGDRRLRRHRLAGGVAALAVAATATATGLVLAGAADRDGGGGQVASAEVGREISWAASDGIHVGDAVVETAGTVASYVLTDAGPVWTREDGTVLTRRGGAVTEIGRTSRDGHYLRSDDSGTLVAWVEFPDGDAPVVVGYDTATGARVLETSEGLTPGMDAFPDGADPVVVHAVDDGAVFWHDADGLVRTDVATGAGTALADLGAFDVADVAGGLVAWTDPERQQASTLVGPLLPEGLGASLATEVPHEGNANLSPDGAHVAFEDADELFVSDTVTGEDVAVDLPRYAFSAVVDWLDDDTFWVFGVARAQDFEAPELPMDLLTCQIGSGRCEVSGSTTVPMDALAFPVGEGLDD